MEPFTPFRSRVVILPVNDIDTDQIIPARFLKVTDKAGLGANLFHDWRYRQDGNLNPDFELNKPANQGAQILLVGDNFGCGSSREHAPWALQGFGFKTVISTSFADIFRNNALKNGLLPVQLNADQHQALLDLLAVDPDAWLEVDLASQNLVRPDGQKYHFPIDSFSRTCLLNGTDELGYLLGLEAQISAYEETYQK
jgi:3-isopropylmalate/(R)-2-methylmalate dehydratase small subunit